MSHPPPCVFISYSHKDERWLERLLVHLKPLARAGTIVPWADTGIRAGESWRLEIARAIDAARVAVLLVSADFLASDFIAKDELPPLLDAARTKGLLVIPVIVSPCRYEQTTSLSSLQAINPASKALSKMTKPEKEEYFVKLSIQIESVLSPVPGMQHHVGTGVPEQGGIGSSLVTPFPLTAGGYFVRSTSEDSPVSDQVGANVPMFATRGEQWALIVGTEPKWLRRTTEPLSMEMIDAVDVSDWFWSPDVYGPIPSERLFFFAGSDATSEAISLALDRIASAIGPNDSLLFYFSGHATTFSDPGELILYDAPNVQTGKKITDKSLGILSARVLVDWCNRLRAEKIVCILDSGGPACYKASRALLPGRYFISGLNCRYVDRNGVLTWYVRRTMHKIGRDVTVAQLHQILTAVDQLLEPKLDVYLRGRDLAPGNE